MSINTTGTTPSYSLIPSLDVTGLMATRKGWRVCGDGWCRVDYGTTVPTVTNRARSLARAGGMRGAK